MFNRFDFLRYLLAFIITTVLTFCLMEITGKIYGRTIWNDLLWAAIFSFSAVVSSAVLDKVLDTDYL